LENCPDCRREEAIVRELHSAIDGVETYAVSPDFNSRLLKRIAEERFKETRTKAFMPKKIPILSLNRIAPVVAAACFVFAFIFAGGIDRIIVNDESPVVATIEPDNSYATVRENRDQTVNAYRTQDWAFQKQLARANRIKDLMTRLSNESPFSTFVSQPGRTRMGGLPIVQLSYPGSFRTFSTPETLTVREVSIGN
jgi:hypothetical protein